MGMPKIKQYLLIVIFVFSTIGQGIFHSHGFFSISGAAHHSPQAAEQTPAPLKAPVCFACLAERNPSQVPAIPYLAECQPLQLLCNPLPAAPDISSPLFLRSPRSPPALPA